MEYRLLVHLFPYPLLSPISSPSSDTKKAPHGERDQPKPTQSLQPVLTSPHECARGELTAFAEGEREEVRA